MWNRIAVVVCLAMLAACGGVQVKPAVKLPVPLVEKIPGSVGVVYTDEFRKRAHSEERRNVKYSVALGESSVRNVDWLLSVVFERVVPIAERGQIGSATPPVALVVVPALDDYSFVTPQETASGEYSVTIRYRFELLDPRGSTVDQLTLTGFGTAPAGKVSVSAPLNAATQMALRDFAAKFILDFPQQDAVARLLRGETLSPMTREDPEVNVALGVFDSASPSPATSAATPGVPSTEAAAPPVTPDASAPVPSAPPVEEPAMPAGPPPLPAVPAPDQSPVP